MIFLFRISRFSLSRLSSASCWVIVLLQASMTAFWNSFSGSPAATLDFLCLIALLGYLNAWSVLQGSSFGFSPFFMCSTGCFRVNEIMCLLISQSIKHLNRLDRSYIFTESIAFWCMISKKCHNHSVVIHLWRLRRCKIEEIWKIHWKSMIKKHQHCFSNISSTKAQIFMKF